MKIERKHFSDLVENRLPDGSRILVDPQCESVFALNTTAGAAWDACQSPTTVPDLITGMERSLGVPIPQEVAEEAVLLLEEKNLVLVHESSPSSRRRFLVQLGTVAIPLVVAMTMTEQRAYANSAQSLAPTDPVHHKHHDRDRHHHKNGSEWDSDDPQPLVY